MVHFCNKNIVCRFRTSYKIVFDNRLQFNFPEMRKFCDDLDIKTLVVIYPQASGQVKAINKILKQNLKTKLDKLKHAWAEELPNSMAQSLGLQ